MRGVDAGKTLFSPIHFCTDILGPGDTISGTLSSGADVDVFHIVTSGSLYISTVGSVSFTGDTQLFLFDSEGSGLGANDDTDFANFGGSGVSLGATIGPIAQGDYLLAISLFDNDPLSMFGLMWPSTPFTEIFGPTGLELTGWTGAIGNDPPYTITLSASPPSPAPIPEPASLLLLGSGLATVGGLMRRRHRQK